MTGNPVKCPIFLSIMILEAIALYIALSILASCGYFDILNPRDLPIDTSITWQKTMGGSGEDAGSSVQQTTDGGYIISGYTEKEPLGIGDFDVWLIKTDASGVEEWSKTFGGIGEDRGHFAQQTADGGYIITGSTMSFGAGGNDVWMIKTDASGDEQWSKTFGGSGDDQGRFVQCTSDDGYIIAGFTYSFDVNGDVYLIKTDASGIDEWNKTFGGSSTDQGFSVRQTTDGGYIVVGSTYSPANMEDAYLIRTDASGIEERSKTFGGDFPDGGTCIQQTTDGGYIISGETRSFGAGDLNAWLIKTDASGNEQWSKTFGGNAWDRAEAVQQTVDGGYIIAGMTRSFGPWEEVWLIKTDALGNEQWNKTFGGDGNDHGFYVQQTADGGYIIIGYTDSYGAGDRDVYLIYYKP